MGVKYFIEYSRHKIYIDVPNYSGTPIEYYSVGGSACIIDTEDNDHLRTTKANISFYSTDDLFDLKTAQDLTVKVTVYRDNSLLFSGFLISDGLVTYYSDVRTQVSILASDGINSMQDIEYTYVNPAPLVMPTYTAVRRTPLEYINRCFQIIGNQLPIRWSIKTTCLLDESKDVLSGRNSLTRGSFVYYDGVDCLFILEYILKSLNLKISQINGYWYIWNEIDLLQNNFVGYQLNGTTVTNFTEDTNILNPQLLGSDNTYEAQKGISNVEVEYNPIQDINIIPNGNFNITSTGSIANWYSDTGIVQISDDNISMRTTDDLGQSEVSLSFINGGELYFESESNNRYMPIDGRQFPRFTMGFRIMPENYPVGTDEYILWEERKPFSMQIKYTREVNNSIEDWYLNENGFWVRDTGGNLRVQSTTWVNNDGLTIVLSGSAVQGQTFRITEYIEDIPNYTNNIDIDFNTSYNTTEQTINYIISQEPNSFQKINATTIKFLGSGQRYTNSPTVSILNGQGVTTTNWVNFLATNVKNGDVLEYQFQSKANANSIQFPDCGDVNIDYPNGKGYFSLKFKQITGVRTVLDELWLKFDEHIKTFTFKDDSVKSDKETFELRIGSGFNGFELTSYSTDFSDTDKQMMFRRNGKVASLPEHYGWDFLIQNKEPRLILNANINRHIRPHNIVTVEGKKYFVSSRSFNTETNQTQVVLKECKINDVGNINVEIS